MNIQEEFKKVTEYASPRILGEVNDQYIKIAKIGGEEIPWHNHENEDEMFYIVEGELKMEIRDREPFLLRTGEFHVVPKGVDHRVSATADCFIMLIESKSTLHTGKVQADITKSVEEQRY